VWYDSNSYLLQDSFLHSACRGLHSAQLPFSLPWGQGVQSTQLRFSLPWGQGLHSTQLYFTLPCGHGLPPHNGFSPFHASIVFVPSRLVYDGIAQIPRPAACGYRISHPLIRLYRCLGSVRQRTIESARARSVVRSSAPIPLEGDAAFFRDLCKPARLFLTGCAERATHGASSLRPRGTMVVAAAVVRAALPPRGGGRESSTGATRRVPPSRRGAPRFLNRQGVPLVSGAGQRKDVDVDDANLSTKRPTDTDTGWVPVTLGDLGENKGLGATTFHTPASLMQHFADVLRDTEVEGEVSLHDLQLMRDALSVRIYHVPPP
jgi:hypothetical protein